MSDGAHAAEATPTGGRTWLTPALAIVATALAAGSAWFGLAAVRGEPRPAPLVEPWFAPYVDVTLLPIEPFGDPASPDLPRDLVLSFVVAAPDRPCAPTWGGLMDVDVAAAEIDLDGRIEHFRQLGGDVVVGFGGANGTELSMACEDEAQLFTAYAKVIDRYRLATIDLDLEDAAIHDQPSIQRRARVMKALQDRASGNDRHLAVWVTVPTTADGLLPDAVAVVDTMLQAGVDLAGVNLMAMNYGGSRQALSMLDATTQALKAAHRQLDRAYRRVDLRLSEQQLWRKLGVTPMIGVNNVPGEQFTPEDAAGLLAFQQDVGLGRLSFWSLNRDVPCPRNADASEPSGRCSGVHQEPRQFLQTLDHLSGRPQQAAEWSEPLVTIPVPVDDPSSSPHPIWQSDVVYDEGDWVVWRRRVYQAKWVTRGDLPDAPVVNEWDSPWREVRAVTDD